jgi:hypothetical protein
MRKILYIIALAVLLLFAFRCIIAFKPSGGKKPDAASPARPAERIGEKIVYEVKLGRLSLGRAQYDHLMPSELNGKMVSHMTFETRLARFKDLERVYSDPDTFLPLQVERQICVWPVSEQITEKYDQKNFSLTIVKRKFGKMRETVIKKDSPIHNAITLPFYVRRMDSLQVGWSMKANLPGEQFEIKLVSIEEVSVPAGSFKSYHFTSIPQRFEIWISADERKIPLKIKGGGALGYTFLMKEYSL